jgi:hypothetical protein
MPLFSALAGKPLPAAELTVVNRCSLTAFESLRLSAAGDRAQQS